MSDSFDSHQHHTYTIKLDPVNYNGVLYTTLTLPVNTEFIVEKQLEKMNGVYKEAQEILKRF